VLRVPPEIPLPDLARVGHEIDRLESEIFACCQEDGFAIEQLVATEERVMAQWPGKGATAR
jgi:hypothetical protein